ncbi:MAG: SurA N-terminal domain-containing protein [Campylobacteraceae bacterium]|nr:SurA N-terminal domain-containing protein [Campylobacteraceae bacterium]
MITWMQKHKKWLVVTIWISTIAFVGAGFVGWGSYDFGKTSGSVAVVGDREISVDEYQREYSSLYSQYARIFGTQFNNEMAKQMNLSDAALRLVIQKNLILSYGDSLGLAATNEEVVKELIQMSAFIKNGKFDKKTYVQVLAQNSTTPTVFEKAIERNILLKKVEDLFKFDSSKNEIEALSSLMFLEDNLDIKVLDIKDITFVQNEEKMKKFWLKNKFNYMSATSYDLSINKVLLSTKSYSDDVLNKEYKKSKHNYKKTDGKLKTFDEAKKDLIRDLNIKESKKLALKEYINLKKSKNEFTSKITVFENELNYSAKDLQNLSNAKENSILKPFLVKNEFIIVKVNKIIPPKPLSFEKAYNQVLLAFQASEKKELLEKKADLLLKDFRGENIGFVSRKDINKIKSLNANEASTFLNKLFTVDSKMGKIDLGNKVVLYKINDSRFSKANELEKTSVKESIYALIDGEIMNNLVKKLEKTYEVKSSLNTESKE